jgi:hypothetical protein
MESGNILIDLSLMVLFIIVGWYLREQAAKRAVERLLEGHGITPEMKSDNVVVCYMETHGDMMYLYGVLGDKFYAQANTHEELHKILDKLYPGQMFIVPDPDDLPTKVE